jgi:hypothetical protein
MKVKIEYVGTRGFCEKLWLYVEHMRPNTLYVESLPGVIPKVLQGALCSCVRCLEDRLPRLVYHQHSVSCRRYRMHSVRADECMLMSVSNDCKP